MNLIYIAEQRILKMNSADGLVKIEEKLDKIINALQGNKSDRIVDTIQTNISNNMITRYLEDIQAAITEAYRIVERSSDIMMFNNSLKELNRKILFKQSLYKNIDISGTGVPYPLYMFFYLQSTESDLRKSKINTNKIIDGAYDKFCELMKNACFIEIKTRQFNETSRKNINEIICLMEKNIAQSKEILCDGRFIAGIQTIQENTDTKYDLNNMQIIDFLDNIRRLTLHLDSLMNIFETDHLKSRSQVGKLVNEIQENVKTITSYHNPSFLLKMVLTNKDFMDKKQYTPIQEKYIAQLDIKFEEMNKDISSLKQIFSTSL